MEKGIFDKLKTKRESHKNAKEVTPFSRMRSTNRVSVTDRVVTEAEGAGPTVEKWRVCLKRTAVERKHRTQSRRDRAGA